MSDEGRMDPLEAGYEDGFARATGDENLGTQRPAGGATGYAEPRTPIEQAADTARAQATQAADAFRRGEFMRDATNDPGASADDRLIALLTYLIPLFMPILVLLSESSKTRPFQRFHAVQSLALTCIFVGIGALVSISTAFLQIIPPLGFVVGIAVLCMTPIALLMFLVAIFYYGYQAYQGKRFAIPGLTSFLQEQGWI
ncbi:MAG: hypothetical protein R2932_06625 [Caldilineaceae bacterium]